GVCAFGDDEEKKDKAGSTPGVARLEERCDAKAFALRVLSGSVEPHGRPRHSVPGTASTGASVKRKGARTFLLDPFAVPRPSPLMRGRFGRGNVSAFLDFAAWPQPGTRQSCSKTATGSSRMARRGC